MSYRRLDPEHIIATAQALERRISERFEGSGLQGVASELVRLAGDTARHAESLAGPVLWLRILVAVCILCGAAVFLFVGTFLSFDRVAPGGFDFVQGIEALINTLVLIGIGMFALIRAESRYKHRAVLAGLHQLRSLIHIIDMHQLTKDPAMLNGAIKPTKSSPARRFNAAELTRYLDYCSEMLSITGKLAALYAQSVGDEMVVRAVNDVESLGTNLSRKIWQKIMLIGPAASR